MTKFTTFDLSPFYRNTVGIDKLFERVMHQLETPDSNYPPFDIVKTGENTYEIRIAVAGFKQGDIDIELYESTLKITGSKQSVPTNFEYMHRGIGNRNFTRTFPLADYVEVVDAVIIDGILTVYLERIVPEVMKPKKIAIKHQSPVAAITVDN